MVDLTIGGWTPLTTIDFPGRLSAVVFCQGCPWRCDYCHNPQLLPRHQDTGVTWVEVMSFLERRKGLLDGVVFSGGEPTLQKGLEDAIEAVKDMNFQVGLHTAGAYPARLNRILDKLDWVGMDIKAPFDQYETQTAVPKSGNKALESAQEILRSGIAHEFRTTFEPRLSEQDIISIALTLAELGVQHYVLQACRSLNGGIMQAEISRKLLKRLEGLFEDFAMRGHFILG